MKKSIYLVALAAAALLMAGCTKEMDFEGEISFSSEYICFTATPGSITTKAPARHGTGNYFSMEEEDWVLEMPTKGNPTTAFSGNAAITGFLYESWTGSEEPWSVMYKKPYSFNGTVLDAVSDPIPWVVAGNNATNLRVYAYAPADFGGTLSAANAAGVPTITYTVPSSVADQKDLIVATSNAVCASKTSVPLAFSHALTAVKFNVDFACTVKSIEVQGVYTHGVYTIGGAWSSVGTEGDFTIDLGSGVECKKGSSVTDGANTLMMIPQTVPAGAQVVMTYDEGTGDQTLTALIEGGTWNAGKRITYTISKNPPTYIYFDLAAGPVTIIPSGAKYVYTGYVYKNNGTGTATVTGDHVSSNEYYIYQSSTESTSPGYYPNTGYEGESGVVRVPEYPKVMSPDGSKSWSEFITNNKHSEDIIGLWNQDYDYKLSGTYKGQTHPVYTAGRTGTNNCILFRAGLTGVPLIIDVILDNVFCTQITNLASKKDGGPIENAAMSTNNVPGTYSQFFVNNAGGESGTDGANIGVEVKLKGDNFFNGILFDTRKPDDYFHVTSFEGDGSSSGSLTVTPPYNRLNTSPSTFYFQSSIEGSFCSVQTRTYTHYGLAIQGGTLYIATPLYYKDNTAGYTHQCFGAGANSHIYMDITGGVVTAVSRGTAPAIGAGGGFNYIGGDGYVTITGGKVYAYQYGAAANIAANRYPVTSTAIGGGSSFRAVANSGHVTISGNAYVYAESVGGVAIGGGSSGGLTGGAAVINISGNPTIIAKSLAGTIYDFWGNRSYSVTAGTAIGGGSGGDENYKLITPEYGTPADAIASGGDATVSISGGQVFTGSFGGGKNGIGRPGGFARKLGTAQILISDGDVQGQFIMAAGAATKPSFTMTGGTLNNSDLLPASGFYKVRDNGGAVYIEDGDFTMTGGEIRNASAVNGGVVYMTNGSFTLSGGSILNSTATGKGGAVYIAGTANPTFEMSGGIISGCNADSDGGAVYLEGGTVTITEGIIRRNKALGGSGGGICINKGSFTMSDGAINGNYADVNGGGVYISSEDTDVSATVSGGTITENTSEKWGGGLCILPGGVSAANVTLGATGRDELSGLLTNPDISGNRSKFAGGGVYTAGSNARITINSGKINNNQVTAYVANENVANEGGGVTLLDGDVTHQVVTFHANGGYYDSNPAITEKTQNIVTSTNSSLVTPGGYARAGYHFVEWNSRSDGHGTTYTNGQPMNITEDVDLYIIWALD